MTLSIGDKAPAFTLPDQNGNDISLSDYKGQLVVLYFYPKALTPGCTTQAENLRDSIKEFEKLNAKVIGVSADETKKLAKFEEKHNLPFTLVGDTEHTMLEAYDMWKEKSMYGRKYMGITRSTFIIDEPGVIQKVWSKVKVPGHVEDVLASL